MAVRTLARLAVDIGGTFTDVVIERADRQWTAKVPTVPGAPERGVIDGIAAALEVSGIGPEAVGFIVHGTTLATNALIERKGARTALLVTEGFRDTIELGTESRFDQYDINLRKSAPLIPRHLRLPVFERVAADGAILRPLDESSVWDAITVLRREAIESVAIALLHSYVEPAHERRIREIIARHLPDVSVSISSEVSPEMREYERFTTTCANAYVRPLVAGYLTRLEQELIRRGFSARLFLMLSNGGLTTVETASAFPVRLLESGPAGGAIYARTVAEALRAERVLSFDMGGTTAKVCLIDHYQPQMARVFEVDRSSRFRKGSGMPVRIPVIDMVEIGAGGGSIAHVDRLKRIGVGPESAGSEPGPACFGRGGREPTVTDADLALGRIDVSEFAGGRIKPDKEVADAALSVLAQRSGLNLDAESCAHAIVELVDESMANAARVHAVESGRTLTDRTLIAFGGAAPLHASRAADKLGIGTVVVPWGAGVGSAIGFLLAPVSYEVARSRYVRLAAFPATSISAMLDEMAHEASAVVESARAGHSVVMTRSAYARYVGQGHEISLQVPAGSLDDDAATTLRQAFERAYFALYGRLIEGIDVEILGWTVTVATAFCARRPTAGAGSAAKAANTAYWREVFDPGRGGWRRFAIHRRTDLVPGDTIAGPAIITEAATSTVIGPMFDARIDAYKAIVMTRRQP